VQPRSVEERLTMLEGQMQELRDLPERVTNLELQFAQFRQEMRDGFSAMRSEMKEGFAELSRQMRMLHEEAISRIATMAEGRRSKKR
jgi:uncharacterized coiled-coil protein SlyX